MSSVKQFCGNNERRPKVLNRKPQMIIDGNFSLRHWVQTGSGAHPSS